MKDWSDISRAHRAAIVVTLGFCALAACLIAIFVALASQSRGPRPASPKNISEVWVWIGDSTSGNDPTFKIADPEEIRNWIEAPLEQSSVDPRPADYVILGAAILRYEDGHEEILDLFLPWGHYKRDRKYMIADFRLLQDGLRRKSGKLTDRDRRVFELVPN